MVDVCLEGGGGGLSNPRYRACCEVATSAGSEHMYTSLISAMSSLCLQTGKYLFVA